MKAEHLTAKGFSLSARWELQENSRIRLSDKPPKQPGVYAFAVDGEVCYVGKTRKGIAERLRNYETVKNNIKKKERQGVRIRTLISKALKSGSEVIILTIVNLKPIRWRGLPVDLIAGLEAALIRELQPKTKWNLRAD